MQTQLRDGSFAFRVVPGLAYLVAVFVGGSLPSGGGAPSLNDKVLHFGVFLVFAMLIARSLSHYRPQGSRGLSVGRAVLLSSVAGGALELWQFLLPHRSCEFLDWVADTAGAVVGGALVWAAGAAKSYLREE